MRRITFIVLLIYFLLLCSKIDPLQTYRYRDHSPGGFNNYGERLEFIRIATKHGLYWRGKATNVWVVFHEKSGKVFLDKHGRKCKFE